MNLPIIPKQSPYQVPVSEQSSTIVPLLSRKFSTPLCSTLHTQKEPFSENIRQSYRETQQENSDSMGTIVHKKYSLRDIFKPNANADEALETKKEVSLQKNIRGYNGLGQTVKRLNGVLPKQFVIKRESSSRNNPFNETEHVNTEKNNLSKEKKHLSEDKMSSKRNLNKIISLERICRNSPPKGHEYKTNNNIAKPIETNNQNSDNRELTKIGIILSKGNHKTLLAKLNQPPAPTKSILSNESIHMEPHMSNGGQSPRYQTVALGSFFENSMGFGESIIEERQISNESSFLEENGRELLEAITHDHHENDYNSNSFKDKEIEKRKRENNRTLGKRGWRKLPNDFIQYY